SSILQSHDILKCYMCTSVTDKDCGDDIIKSQTIKPMECTMEEMTKWQNIIQQNKLLTPIFSIFAVDNPQQNKKILKNMACAKVDTKIQGQDKIVTIRSCQTAQAENVDPCTSIEGKLYGGMEYCGLCEENGCNDSITISPSISNIIFTIRYLDSLKTQVPGAFLLTASDMVEYLTMLTIFLLFNVIKTTGCENLWCYECNTNLKNGHQRECNDPYSPGHSMSLVFCPKNESFHCLKDRNIMVTVRGCVPSRKIDHYCDHEQYYPHSSIECFFCEDYACNNHPSMKPNSIYILGIVLMALSSALRCWECSSHMNAMCGDPMNSTDHQAMFHVKECGRGPYASSKPICRKMVKRDGGDRVVIRSCAIPNHDETDITDGPCSPLMTNGRDMVESCHICNTDLCNSASGLLTTQSLYIAGFILIGYRFFESNYNRK
ncbi:hypothetical protein V1478_003204, partial [Vespula squamosa]